MNNESEESHYYKIVKDIDVNLEPYIVMPMYDEHQDLGTFHSTIDVDHQQKGDFIICNGEDIWFDSRIEILSMSLFLKKLIFKTYLQKILFVRLAMNFTN